MKTGRDAFEILHSSLPVLRRKLIAQLDRRISENAAVVSVIGGELVVHERGRSLRAMATHQPSFDFA